MTGQILDHASVGELAEWLLDALPCSTVAVIEDAARRDMGCHNSPIRQVTLDTFLAALAVHRAVRTPRPEPEW